MTAEPMSSRHERAQPEAPGADRALDRLRGLRRGGRAAAHVLADARRAAGRAGALDAADAPRRAVLERVLAAPAGARSREPARRDPAAARLLGAAARAVPARAGGALDRRGVARRLRVPVPPLA